MKRSCLTGYEATADRRMHATEVLSKCLGESLHAIHCLLSRVLMRAVEVGLPCVV